MIENVQKAILWNLKDSPWIVTDTLNISAVVSKIQGNSLKRRLLSGAGYGVLEGVGEADTAHS